MRHVKFNECGQSALIIVLAFTGLVAFLAIVVDGGNIYAQRRQVQNAVDAAAYAGGETLARPTGSPPTRATNGQVSNAIQTYARKNNVDPDTACVHATMERCVKAYYTTRDTAGKIVIDSQLIESYGLNVPAPTSIGGRPVVGVSVKADKKFDSYFAGVVGWQSFTVASGGGMFASPPSIKPPEVPPTTGGACCSDDLFPITLSSESFKKVLYQEQDNTEDNPIWEKSEAQGPGNFGYVNWGARGAGTQGPDVPNSLVPNMKDPSRSGRWHVGEWVPATPGAKSSPLVRNQWVDYITNQKSITIPIYDSKQGQGNNLQYRIAGFARFLPTGFCAYKDTVGTCTTPLQNNSERYVQGKWQQWVTSECEGSCSFYGVSTTKPHLPTDPTRSLIGVVKINRLDLASTPYTSTTHVPVDVVHLLDISGSMDRSFGRPAQQKITVAQSALVNFNKVISPTLGDRLGLATFPKVVDGKKYTYSCTQTGSTTDYLYGKNEANLTSNISSVNKIINGLEAGNGTPLAGGLLVARAMVLDPLYHSRSNVPVLVVASDGIANVRTSGQWTGFQGSTYSDEDCNRDAVQEAVDQANKAKSDSDGDGKPDTIIFTIAIGTDFNSDALRAIASKPASQHFFTASDASTMQSIYEKIAQKTQNITTECTYTYREIFAPGVRVRVRETTTGSVYETTATTTGYFAFANIPAGTYEFLPMSVSVAGLNYHIYTAGIGGPELMDPPKKVVLEGNGSYEQNLFLAADDPVCK